MSKAPSHRVHVILSVEQYNALAAEAKRTGAPMAELIRRAIAEGLKRKVA